MGYFPFSKKQIVALTWWNKNSPFYSYDGIICDGAVRSGKTKSMSIGFVVWAMSNFESCNFAICGKTITSLRRNVVRELTAELKTFGLDVKEKLSQNMIEICHKDRVNCFYLFGGRDESSCSLIQGVTLAGVLFDEVALMPRSFVEQALARCSVNGSKFWFNCNPENPQHWFYQEWIRKKEEKNILYVHFKMTDNPSLTPKILARYQNLYSGTFYERFVLGKWVAVQGLVYPNASDIASSTNVEPPPFEKYYISCDYGTVNPFSLGLWGKKGERYYRIDEYYFNSRVEGEQKTDEEYYSELEKLIGSRKIEKVVVDPSAASFITLIKRKGKYSVTSATNDVIDGIRLVADKLKKGEIVICKNCINSIKEFSLYRWQEGSVKDAVKKENDHAMDDIRYFVATIVGEQKSEEFFGVATVTR